MEEICLRTSEGNDGKLEALHVVTRLWLDVDMVTECWHGSRRSALDMTGEMERAERRYKIDTRLRGMSVATLFTVFILWVGACIGIPVHHYLDGSLLYPTQRGNAFS